MGIVLLFEAVLVSVFAALLGYILDRRKAAVPLFSFVFFANGFTALFVWVIYELGYFPIHHLPWNLQRFPLNYLGIACLILEVATWSYLLSAALGYMISDAVGAGIAVLFTFVLTTALFLLSMPFVLFEIPMAAVLFAIAIFVMGAVLLLIFCAAALRGKGMKTTLVTWGLFYVLIILGHRIAGRPGLYLISLPVGFLMPLSLYFLVQNALSINPSQRRDAFKSLLTYTLGTNYPYYVIGDWKKRQNRDQRTPDPRVKGNPFGQLYAGPGIVITDANHVAVLSTGFDCRVCPPGLNFTRKFESLSEVVDLRPQLRGVTVKAETGDGILMEIPVFLPHRIAADERSPALGQSYPFEEDAIKSVVCELSYVDHQWKRDDKGRASEGLEDVAWDELVLMQAPSILRQEIVKYTCNDLHCSITAGGSSQGTKTVQDPRVEITGAFVTRLREKMKSMGIEMVGGGIGNISPPPDVGEQRIKNWSARWQRRIGVASEQAETDADNLQEKVKDEAQMEVLQELMQILKDADESTAVTVASELRQYLSGE